MGISIVVVALFIVLITNLTLGLFIFFRNIKSQINQAFFGIVVSILIWSIGNYIGELPLKYGEVLFWTRITFLGAFFIPAFLLYFSINFPNEKGINFKYGFLIFVPPAILSALLFNGFIVKDIVSLDVHPIEPIFDSIYSLFVIYFLIFTLLSLTFLFIKTKKAKVVQKIQIYYIISGFFLALSLGIVTNLILPFLGRSDLGDIGPLFTIIFVAFTSYAIIRHKLMDIRFLVVKSIVFFLLLLTVASIYFSTIFILGSLVFKSFTGREAYWAAMVVAVIVSFIFQPIRRVFTKWTDKIFFKEHYDFEDLTSKLSEVATSTIILPELLFKFLNSLLEEMRITRGAFILIENGKIYETESIGYKQALNLEEPEIKHLFKEKKTEIFDEVEEGSECKEIMRKYNASLVLPLETEGETIGFLFLGEKKSGDIYTPQDIRVLEIITSQLSLGVQNAKAYEKTQKFNLILRAEINRATKELRDVNERLMESDKAKDEFISMASHEIRTPIATLEGYLSMLNTQKLRAQEANEVAKRSYEGVEKLSTLVKDLLDVSRIDQKRLKINKQPTRLERLIQRTVEGFELQAQDKGIYIKFEKPGKMLPEVKIDPDRIGEVLNNLIDNALKFTSKGGITISLTQRDREAVVAVADTGAGIPKDSVSHLFEKFYQAQTASSALSNEKGGTGLGLYITKTIIELHGGRIWVESQLRKGTTFYFALPL